MSTLSEVERDRLLEAGRRLLSERRKNPAGLPRRLDDVSTSLPNVSSRASVDTGVNGSLPTPGNFGTSLPRYSSTSQAPDYYASPSAPRPAPASASPYQPPSPVRSTGTFSQSTDALSPSAQRDQSLQKRVNELTVERSEIAAKLFKQEKTNEELQAQNTLLRQRVASFESAIGDSQRQQEQISSLEERNRTLQAQLSEMAQQHEEERRDWDSAQSTMTESSTAIESLARERDELQSKVMQNLQTFQETLDENKDNELRLQKTIESQSAEMEKLRGENQALQNELSAVRKRAADAERTASEKEQQLNILYKESEKRQRDNQDNRSFLNQKNEVIQNLQDRLHSLTAEKQQTDGQLAQQKDEMEKLQISIRQLQNLLQQKDQELTRSEENYSRLLNETSMKEGKAKTPGDAPEKLGGQVATMNQLQETIERLTNENKQLHGTVDQYQELLDNMQHTSNEISATYDETIAEIRSRHEEEIRRLLQSNNQLQSQVRALSERKQVAEQENGFETVMQQFATEFKQLEELRVAHRHYKPEPSESVEEIQEKKIHQLLEEVNLMEQLVRKVGIVDKMKDFGRDPALENQLTVLSSRLETAQQEKQALLNAIETGDLSEFVQIQERLNESAPSEPAAEEQTPEADVPAIEEVPEIAAQSTEQTSPETKPKKRGWFW